MLHINKTDSYSLVISNLLCAVLSLKLMKTEIQTCYSKYHNIARHAEKDLYMY